MIGGVCLNRRFKNLRNSISASMSRQGASSFVQRTRDFVLVASFIKLELFKCQPETLFLVANSLLRINELLLFQLDPLRVKPETLLDLEHVTMEVL